MVVAPLTNTTEILAQHLETLREYGKRVLIDGDSLTVGEAQDKTARLEEFLAIADSYGCNEKEMVRLLFKGFFK